MTKRPEKNAVVLSGKNVTIREYRPGDEEAILDCFNLVFASVGPPFVPRSREFWSWLYQKNPAGHRIFLAENREGAIVAHYAGIPLRTWLEGETRLFSQIVDSMAHPDYRQGKPSLFVQVAQRWLDRHCDSEPHEIFVNYGLPVRSAWNVGKTWLRYEMVRELHVLVRPVGPDHASPALPEEIDLVETDRVGEWIELLWRPFRDTLPSATIRDAAYLNWRYADKPDAHYRFVIARTAGIQDARGLIVYKAGRFDTREGAILVDWMVPAYDKDAGIALVHWLCEQARRDGAQECIAAFPTTYPWFFELQELGFRVRPSSYFMVARNSLPEHSMEWLRNRWYYTLGDTDLV